MNRGRMLAALIGCLTLQLSLRIAAASPLLIGSSPNGIMYDVDPATGLASNPRNVGIGEITGLAWSPAGVLYARTGFFSDRPNSLFTVEVDTGVALLIGSIGISGWDFDFDPETSLLFGKSLRAGTSGTTLYTISPETSDVDLIATIGLGGGSVVLDTFGSLYVLADDAPGSDVLELLDKTNGNTLQEWSIGTLLGRPGLAFASDGTLFIADGSLNGTGNFYTFDLASGVLTLVGPTQVDDGITALAVIPEPATGLFLIVGATVLALRKRRNLFFLATVIAAVWILPPGVSRAQTPGTGGIGGVSGATETGLGPPPTLIYRDSLQGDFVVAGTNTRVFGVSVPRSDDLFHSK